MLNTFVRQLRALWSQFMRKQWVVIWGPTLLLIGLLCLAAPWIIKPACPKQLVISTGDKSGAYYQYALAYQKILAHSGIELKIRTSSGSLDNIQWLCEECSDTHLALMQGGIRDNPPEPSQQASPPTPSRLVSLGSLFREPIWIFYRGEKRLEHLTQLRGKTVAIGSRGSGTRAIAKVLLHENHLLDRNEAENSKTVELTDAAAAQSLQAGEIDAAIFVVSPDSQVVKDLLANDSVRLMSIRRAAAYQKRYPYLSRITLHEGILDLQQNRPDRDITLLASTANLVASKDLHPALVPLLLDAAEQVHGEGSILHLPEEFPSADGTTFALSSDARRYFRKGPSLLYRWLPFSLAVWIDRMKMMLLPLLTLMLPLFKAAPPLYRWRIRSKIYRWYRVLREVDQRLQTDAPMDYAREIESLHQMEEELAAVSVPLSYMEEFYNLRLHVSFVLSRLVKKQARETASIPADDDLPRPSRKAA